MIIKIVIILGVIFYNFISIPDVREYRNVNENSNIIFDEQIEEINPKIEFTDIDGKNTNFSFRYKNDIYIASYTEDNWHIDNSYKIKDREDMITICQGLINIHPIHSVDKVSYRTADDMADEWIRHNLAYEILPDDNPWKENAKDVDLNPDDQGKNIWEIYKSRVNN